MRTIDAASADTRSRILREHTEMEDDKARGEDVMYGVSAVVGVLLMVCSVALARLIVAPLNDLRGRMAAVAGMDLPPRTEPPPPLPRSHTQRPCAVQR
eukprot:gene9609-22374_t